MHHVNQPLVSVQFCAVKYTQIIVRQLPPSISRTFFILQSANSVPVKQ